MLALPPIAVGHHASWGSPPVDLAILLRDGISRRLVAFHCRKSFAACCLPRHSGFLSFVFWPVGNDRTDELVQKVYRVAHGL